MRLEDKVAIVTGGGSGIGRAICELFAREGAKIIVADIDSVSGNETVAMIKKNNGRSVFVEADVSREKAVKKIVETAVREFGKINVLVNNAAEFTLKTVVELTEEDWNRTIAVNVQGPGFCVKHVVPEMKKTGNGSIVNISSVAGVVALENHLPYGPSKGALIAMNKALARELGQFNVRVNCLSPGGTLTPATYRAMKMWNISLEEITSSVVKETFLNRIAQPVEIAYGALFLASDEASYVTGANLLVDGGWTAH